MGHKEKEIINQVIFEGSKRGRLFRVNCGVGAVGTNLEKYKNKAITHYNIFINKLWDFFINISIKINRFLILINPRPFYGMPPGTPDIIGWEIKKIAGICCGSCLHIEECEYIQDKIENQFEYFSELITEIQEMVCEKYEPNEPKKIAVFKAVEVKTGKQKLSEKQENFKRVLLEQGGIYEEARD